jgi:FAD:protein FMN transferase
MKLLLTLSLLLTTFFLNACNRKEAPIHLEGFTQGTTYHITYFLKGSLAQASAIDSAIENELARIDASISNYRDDSDIEKFNAQTNTLTQPISEEIANLVGIARTLSSASSGCFDVTVKPLFELWGFKQEEFHLPTPESLQETLAQVGINKLLSIDKNHLQKTIPSLQIDLSALGQGYSVGRLATLLEQQGIVNYLVEIGGELKTRGKKADGSEWRIALEKPLPNQRKLEKIVAFHSGQPLSMMTSGTYRHFFDDNGKRYSHILDARTGKPIEHTSVSVTVFHEDPTLADAWSTALLCLGSTEGIKVANKNAIAAFFIDQEAEIFIEIESKTLEALTSITFEEPN